MQQEYYKTKESVEEYIKMAKDVNGAQLIKKFEDFLSDTSRVLEIGSGPGSDWKILNKSHKVVGSDFSQEFLEYLRTENPKGEFLELDATTLLTDKKFDGIYSNKVLHHLSNTELQASIKRQAEILNTKGIICHSFWKGTGDETFKGMYVNYHNKEAIREFYGAYFEILLLETYQEFEESDSLLLIGKKRAKN